MNEQLAAKWTNDCQGKKDYDGSIIRVSTRYWPRGGGFDLIAGDSIEGNDSRPNIRPSACCSIVLCHDEPVEGQPNGQYIVLIEKDFEGESFDEVAASVEAWAQQQYERVVSAVRGEFSGGV